MARIKVGISVGDLNGIGMEVIIKTFLDNRVMELYTPIIFGGAKTSSYHRKALEIKDFSFNIINKIKDINIKRANLLNCWNEEVEIKFGEPSETAGKYASKSLENVTDAPKNMRLTNAAVATCLTIIDVSSTCFTIISTC